MQRDAIFLGDIMVAAEVIERKVRDRTLSDFLADEDTRDIVLLKLIVLGEAAAHLSTAVRQGYPDVSWTDAIAFRNRAVHGYATIDWTVVWTTATIAVPVLRSRVAEILASDYPGDAEEEEPTP